jgi:hypothetical protein
MSSRACISGQDKWQDYKEHITDPYLRECLELLSFFRKAFFPDGKVTDNICCLHLKGFGILLGTLEHRTTNRPFKQC